MHFQMVKLVGEVNYRCWQFLSVVYLQQTPLDVHTHLFDIWGVFEHEYVTACNK